MFAENFILLSGAYLFYFFLLKKNYEAGTHKLICKRGDFYTLKKINGFHLKSILIFFIPFLHTSLFKIASGLYITRLTNTNIAVLLLSTGASAIAGYNAAIAESKKISHASLIYHEHQVIYYLVIRILFILSYESFLRGIVLYTCIFYTTNLVAVFINVILYTLLHIFAPKKELFFTPFFGILLCILTLWTHSILPAAVLHIILTLTYEGYILRKDFLIPKPYRK